MKNLQKKFIWELFPNHKKLILTMKLSLILFVAGMMQVSASIYSQQTRMTFSMKEKSVKEVLDQIEQTTDFRFFYNENFTDLDRRITLDASDNKIEEILDLLLASSDVTYRVLESNLIVITPKAMLQPLKLSGKVTDAGTAEPLAGVYVVVSGTNTGEITDVEGNYTIDLPSQDVQLQFSFIGYNTETIAVAGNKQLNVALIAELTALDEVIVVGYGTQSKRNVTGSIQQVGSDDIVDMPVTTIAQKLQGKLSGVQINQTTGKPGQGMQVRIRGQASLNAGNDPLYVVDNFPIIGDISGINPNEIESISVLKDASSAALYGSRAANGVIMVTTKKARAGKTTVGVNAYYGFQKVPEKGRPEMMNATEFAQFKKESYEDRGVTVPVQFQNPGEYGEGWNYYDAILRNGRNAPIQDYSINLSSSKENFNTTAVFGVFDQKGVVINSDFRRYSIRLNADFKVTDKIQVGLNVAPTYTINNNPNTDGQFWASGIINNSLLTWPIFPYKNEDGSLPLMSWDPTISTFPTPNYYRSAKEITNETKNTRVLANTYLQIEPLPGLVFKSTFNYDFGTLKFANINPSTSSAGFAAVLPTTSSASFRNTQYGSWLNENTLSYKKSIGGHNFELLGGLMLQKFRSDAMQIAITGFPDDRLPTIGAAANINRAGTNNTYSDIQEWSLMSYLSRLNYNFKNKYLVSAAVRGDGSSRFGEDEKWALFPSASLGWIVSEEEFMKNLSIVSFFKIRASYGIVGNNNIGNYTQFATVSSGNSGYNAIFGSVLGSGSSVTQMNNRSLTWEQTAEYDFGFDLGFFKNRLNIGYDYYNRKTKSLLYSVRVAQESGFENFNGNIGELQFWGHEVTLNSQNLVGEFSWSSDFNIAFSSNKVNALYGLVDRIYSDGHITMVGEKIGLFYGMIHEGVYDNQEEFDNSPKAVLSEVGTAKFRDVGGGTDGAPDGIITNGGDNDDRTIIGDPTPKFIFGFTNNFSYKNFDLSVVLAGSYGNDIANMSEQGLTNLDGVFNVKREVMNRWRSPENPGEGKYGKTSSGTAYERDWLSTRFLSDASFLSIKNVTLGYNIPRNLVKFANSLRIYMSVQQLYTFTKYKGVNPEVSMTAFGASSSALNLGTDYGGYPVPRTISFGINMNL